MSDSSFASGQCLCGAVTYKINGEPIGAGQCHCKDCQRASGTGHMSLAFFKADDVDVQGETASFAVTAESGNTNTRHFCPKCGGRLFGENSARPGMLAVAIGSVDDNDWFEPQRIVYVKDKPQWDVTSTDVANFERMPPPPK
ncbi:MAG: GFA family protein [Hyphomicrobiaceae bacterium]